MGVVFQAMHLRLGQRVAIKLLQPGMRSATPEIVERFEREARAAVQLRSEHVAASSTSTHARDSCRTW